MNAGKGFSRRKFIALSTLGMGYQAVGHANKGLKKSFKMDPFQIFDCHLHSSSDEGEGWQWYTVTHNFEEFVRYLDQTGVQRGIINSQRCYKAAKPAEFIAGNREVARNVENTKDDSWVHAS